MHHSKIIYQPIILVEIIEILTCCQQWKPQVQWMINDQGHRTNEEMAGNVKHVPVERAAGNCCVAYSDGSRSSRPDLRYHIAPACSRFYTGEFHRARDLQAIVVATIGIGRSVNGRFTLLSVD